VSGPGKKAARNAASPAPPRGRWIAVAAVLTLVIGGGLFLWLRPKAPGAPQPGAAQPASGAAVSVEAFKGRWLRPDGDYVLEIRGIDTEGRVEAAYFNPNPIHVSRAEASREGAVPRLFVELRDTGYPGATYSLTYEAETRTLRGVYYQPALAQSFDVVFIRMPAEQR